MEQDKRASTVSFSKSESEQVNELDLPSDVNDEETMQLSPHVQTYLAEMSREAGCWGRFLPVPFERAAGKSWWDPTFDSDILEEQYKKSVSSYNKLKFRYCLLIW